ncbi:ABC transporter ATP-binding protein [Limnohabitans sp. TEGF004]|jgi:iron complex transport system ATP-binding protein|uniref:ABC transporter ATP-binding protein n=1 Tax=Limnohabitans sp. TEGF004 TaxID=2986281 RepID=UPI00248FC99C|nr:ABC transporter ATP-binding protein [Limnohabitans sp. TEGF004]
MKAQQMALRLRDVHVSLAGQEVLHGIDMSFAAGRWTSIVGPNGAGKSTLLKAIAGLLPVAGRVFLFDQELISMSRKARAQQLSWLGQNESTSDDLRVWDVVMLGRMPHQDWLAAPSTHDHAVVETALKATQAWDWRERSLGQLSGGERQRVLLARAMAVQAQVMLMDEPLANLDPPHQVDWLEQVRCLTAQNTTVISVLHEVGMALHADDMVVMQTGRVVHQGACSDAATHRAVEAVFDKRIAIHSLDSQWVAVPKL